MLLRFMALVTAVVHMVSAQEGGSSVLHQGESGDSQSVIVTARTRAFLSCESGDIVVKVNFTQPFRGLMYAHRSRTSPCRIHGNGGYYYELRIPLKGCGTWQESPRVFVNNITIRFHPALELEEDETKTVVCRYPPPLTPPPGSIQVIERPTLTPNTVPTRVGTAKLSEVEILIIICLLLFLSLLTLGIGIAYFCLKRRNIHIIRKTTLSASAPPSQITRLSSSNLHPASSLLSSVLGHTVRIPRAVPYSVPAGRTSVMSSPDHPYEDYPASSSTTETTSGELSETSVSSSSLAEDQVDSSKNLLYRKGGPKSILSIPKAILRKTGNKRWQTEPTVHHFYSKSGPSMSTFNKRPEMEDQTVMTVLEPEGQPDDDNYWSVKNGSTADEKRSGVKRNDLQKAAASAAKVVAPVYAQVDKNKKTSAKHHETSNERQNLTKSEQTTSKWSARQLALPGTARRQNRIITEIPEESSISNEVTKNTTVTTSVRREVTETRIVTPPNDGDKKDGDVSGLKKAEILSPSNAASSQLDLALQVKDNPLAISKPDQALTSKKPPKSILIRDVADIYLTTTVETESQEMKTTVTRDIVQEHARKDVIPSAGPPKTDLLKPKETSQIKPLSPSTDNWNVVIRQRKPPPIAPATATDVDASAESNADTDGQEPELKPKFDVKIRTIPPKELKPKKLEGLVPIPPLEMPQTVNMLKEAMMPKNAEKAAATKLPDIGKESKESVKGAPESRDKVPPHRTVRWVDETKDGSRDEGSTVSSTDSFQSSESLRERSSSEVLEVAPTLSSQRRNSDHPMLERSTSEIVTSPEEHSRWVGGVVPVLESLSPEFLANIPIVIQGGFFNRQKSPTPEGK